MTTVLAVIGILATVTIGGHLVTCWERRSYTEALRRWSADAPPEPRMDQQPIGRWWR